MKGQLVIATSEDSLRITAADTGLSLTIPAHLVLAIDKILRHCLIKHEVFDLDLVQDDETGEEGWEARIDYEIVGDMGATPWAAVANLAREIP